MNTSPSNDTLGAVLAGGLSRRMGSKDKFLLKLNGKTLLQHCIERAAPQVGTLIISGNGDLERFSSYKHKVISDEVTTLIGPLGGVISAMRWSRSSANKLKWVMTFASDTPCFPTNCVAKLKQLAESSKLDVAVCSTDGNPQYAFALWSIDTLPHLISSVAQGSRAIHSVVSSLKHDFLPFDDQENAFFNVNTPEDWVIFNQISHKTEN